MLSKFTYFLIISSYLITEINCATFKEEKCEPALSDDCFQDVLRDLINIIDFRHNLPRNVTMKSVQGFCLSMQDALDCCENVMDSKECKTDPRKASFSEWMLTFKVTFNYMCVDHRDRLMDIFLSVNCWNVQTFVECVEIAAGITKVEDVFFKPLNLEECRNITHGFHRCDDYAKVGSCREMNEVKAEVQDMIQVFLGGSHCVALENKQRNIGSILFVPNVIVMIIFILNVFNFH